MEFSPIAHIRSPYMEKFGVPRQSGRADIPSRVVFEKEYRRSDALRGLEEFDRIWLIWVFSEVKRGGPFQATVRPPRLGGNERMGVFATRSPFRPNPIGLSCVKLAGIEESPEGPVLIVEGADLMDGTPILDIKPYLPYADAFPEASGGFTDHLAEEPLQVELPGELKKALGGELCSQLEKVLSLDPRPRYQEDPERVYGMAFAGRNVRFRVEGKRVIVSEAGKLSRE